MLWLEMNTMDLIPLVYIVPQSQCRLEGFYFARGIMKDISQLKNYREKYKRYYGIEFDRKFVVHHIDENRENNDINNLLLLPLKLHSKYHTYKDMFKMIAKDGLCLDLTYSGSTMLRMQLAYLDDFVEAWSEIQKWIEYKYRADMGYEVYPMFRRANNEHRQSNS